jgi:hypothetical protein
MENEAKKDEGVLNDSAVPVSKRHEVGPAEMIRRKNNAFRDGRTNLGTGKPSDIVVD